MQRWYNTKYSFINVHTLLKQIKVLKTFKELRCRWPLNGPTPSKSKSIINLSIQVLVSGVLLFDRCCAADFRVWRTSKWSGKNTWIVIAFIEIQSTWQENKKCRNIRMAKQQQQQQPVIEINTSRSVTVIHFYAIQSPSNRLTLTPIKRRDIRNKLLRIQFQLVHSSGLHL